MSQTFYSIHDYYISHHGVKGQKWGVRRYQNSDGSLTAEGKARYGSLRNMYQSKAAKRSTIAAGVSTAGTIGGFLAGAGMTLLGTTLSTVIAGPLVSLGTATASAIASAIIARTGNTTMSMTKKGDRARKLVEEEAAARASEILSTGVNNKEISRQTGDLSRYLMGRR